MFLQCHNKIFESDMWNGGTYHKDHPVLSNFYIFTENYIETIKNK